MNEKLEENIENRLVFCEKPVLTSKDSSRICQLNSTFEVYPEDVELDFTVCDSLEEVLQGLISMNALGVHIMGSRGYIYSSKVLSEILEETVDSGMTYSILCFPRTFGLRAKIRELLNN